MTKIDLHIHSDLSSDAKGSLEDIARKLKQENVAVAAITNHIPELPGHVWYGKCGAVAALKKERDRLEDQYNVRMLIGAEIDVLNTCGTLAAPEALLREFEFIISGVHRYPSIMRPLPNKESGHYGPAEYFAVSEAVLRNPRVQVLAHPVWTYDSLFPKVEQAKANAGFPEIYKREIMRIAVETGKAVEINADEIWRMDAAWFEFGREFGTVYSVGSDAHLLEDVGRVEKCYDIIRQYGIPQEKIIQIPK